MRQIMNTLADMAVGYAYGQRIGGWLALPGTQAMEEVRRFVTASSLEQIDACEKTFLDMQAFVFDAAQRREMFKLYAWFKICEISRCGEFRGFA